MFIKTINHNQSKKGLSMKMLKTVAVALFVFAMSYQAVKAESMACPGCGIADAAVAIDKAGEPVNAKCMGCNKEVVANTMSAEEVHVCKTCNVMAEKCDVCAAAPAVE